MDCQSLPQHSESLPELLTNHSASNCNTRCSYQVNRNIWDIKFTGNESNIGDKRFFVENKTSMVRTKILISQRQNLHDAQNVYKHTPIKWITHHETQQSSMLQLITLIHQGRKWKPVNVKIICGSLKEQFFNICILPIRYPWSLCSILF